MSRTAWTRFLVSAIGLADIGNDVLGSQPGSPDNGGCTCWCRPPICSTSTTRPQLRHRPGLVARCTQAPPLPVPGVDRGRRLHAGHRALPLPARTCPKVAAKGGPQCTGLARTSGSSNRPPVLGHRHRGQPVGVRQPGHPAELRRAQADAVRADRRARRATRTDRACPDETRSRARSSSSASSQWSCRC